MHLRSDVFAKISSWDAFKNVYICNMQNVLEIRYFQIAAFICLFGNVAILEPKKEGQESFCWYKSG